MVAEDSEMSADSPSRHVTVVDVYDLASGIGKDFEKLIDQFGSDVISNLMPKVISALELLEAFANRNERENEEIAGLNTTVQRLEYDKEQRMEGRKKFDRELEQIEENYRNEIKQLWDMVQRLQDENKRLNSALEQQDQASPTFAIKEDDLTMMLTLRGTVEQQRDHVKQMETDFRAKHQELETVQVQLEKLQRVNKELTRKNHAVQSQGRELVEEKAELISLLQQRDYEIELLKLQLGETERARKDLEQTKLEQDSDRDNVPRFTLAELREVLQEKNQLKARVMELEEELAQLRPPLVPSPQPPECKEEEELVVYGPINKEPDEKLYPWKFGRRDSGVRKFFNRLWSPKRADNDDECVTSASTDRKAKQSTSRDPRSASSASSSRTAVTPTVHYHRATPSPSRHPRDRDNDPVLSVRYSSSQTNAHLSFSSLLADDEANSSQDLLFDGAFVAEEFGESTR